MNEKEIVRLVSLYRPINDFYLYPEVLCDRFGIVSKIDNHHNLPVQTSMTLYEASDNRCKQLPNMKILWSGGIDSTFIVCTYIKNKVPFSIVCDNISIRDNPKFYEWMIKNNIKIHLFNSITEAYEFNDMISGYVADTLFSPLERIYSNVNFESLNAMEIELIERLSKGLKKNIDTYLDIARLLDFSCMYNQSVSEINYIIFPRHHIDSFFNHPDFTNVAYSSFWQRKASDGKPEMKARILEITESADITHNTVRKGTRIIPRLLLTDKNQTIARQCISQCINNYNKLGGNK